MGTTLPGQPREGGGGARVECVRGAGGRGRRGRRAGRGGGAQGARQALCGRGLGHALEHVRGVGALRRRLVAAVQGANEARLVDQRKRVGQVVEELPGGHQGVLRQGLHSLRDGGVAQRQRGAAGASQGREERLLPKARVKAKPVAQAHVKGAGAQQRKGRSQGVRGAHALCSQRRVLAKGGAQQQRAQQRLLVAQAQRHHAVRAGLQGGGGHARQGARQERDRREEGQG